MRLKTIILLTALFFSVPVFCQTKTVQAVKIAKAPKMDGLLNDEAWMNITPATHFIQNYPDVGQPASKKTEVKVVYDNSAIYFGVYLYDNPALVRKQLTARDDEYNKDVDYFTVFLDTYNDKQNGFEFVVTSANVQSDAKLGPNLGNTNNGIGDKSWDAVWESKVQFHDDGWSLEIKIPYLSLRFAKKDIQNWGIQFQRQIRRTNEKCYWNPVEPTINGFVNQFGELAGLKNIQPPLRLSFSPYISTGFRSTPEVNGYTNKWLRSGGMDVKYGINESFTLDATLIPDFGQVISDNEINNLTPYEIKFRENRPFFTEGTEIFNKAGLFYSRRVGATPSKYGEVKNFVANNTDWKINKNPNVTQLYNATKFSGRTKGKLGIGIFNAITAPMHARLHNTVSGKDSTIETEPLTNYNIVVLDQALKNRSYLTFTNTNVIRDGNAQDANVTALDFSFFDKKNVFNIKGSANYSKIFSANAYDGYSTSLKVGKVSGRWQYYALGKLESAYYNPRDLGYLEAANEASIFATASYTHFKPTKTFLTYQYQVYAKYANMYLPFAFNDYRFNASGFWLFKNFWDVSLAADFISDQHDYFVLGDPASYQRYVKRPRFGSLTLSGSTDSRKKLYFNYSVLVASFFNSAPNKSYHLISSGLRYRFSNKFSLDFSLDHEKETDYIISAGREINNESIIAFVDFTDITSVLSGIYNFSPRLNLTLRARHYLSRLKFNRFANVDQNGEPIPRAGNAHFDNFNIFNLDAFLTWDFSLGSRLVVGYKNWLGDDEIVMLNGKDTYLRNLGKLFDLRHGNELTVKFVYFLDYNRLRKK